MRKVLLFSMLFMVIAVTALAQTPVRIFPVAYKSCDLPENSLPATNLWDKKVTVDDKWCCFHEGYQTPQEHWVIMDFGSEQNLDKIVIFHEGYQGNPVFNTEDFDLYLSSSSMDGPWEVLANIVDNTNNTTTVQATGKKARYVKFQIRDSESMGDVSIMNGDFACRVLELEVYALPGPGQAAPSAPVATPATTPMGTPAPFSPFSNAPTPVAQPGLKPYKDQSAFPTPAATPVFSSPTSQPYPATTGGQKILYYFYSPKVQESAELYNNVLGSSQVIQYAAKYKVVPVSYTTDRATFQKYLVIKIPTMVITDSLGNELKRHPCSFTAQQAVDFLR
jgi:hypothetical protein